MTVSEELRRPVTLALIGVAVIGWALFVWSWASAGSERDELQGSVASLTEQNRTLDTELKAQQAAAGTVADLDKRQHDAATLLASAKTSTADLDAARRTMEAQRDAARAALGQAVKDRAVAEQAVSEANMERDRIDAESGASRQGVDALRQQISQFDDQLTKRKAEQATLDKRTSDLRDALASLGEERDTAVKALADATANVEREGVEATAAQRDLDETKQAAAALATQTAAGTAAAQVAAEKAKQTLAALDQQISERKAEAEKEADTARQTMAALNQQMADQAAAERQQADAATQRLATVNQRAVEAEKEADTARQTMTALKQQMADESAARRQAADIATQRLATVNQQIAERAAEAEKEAGAAKQTLDALHQQTADQAAAQRQAADAATQRLATLNQQIAEQTAEAEKETSAAKQTIAALNQQVADRTAAARQEDDAATGRLTALNQRIADGTQRLAGLQRDAVQLRAETAQKSEIESQLSVAREALNEASKQRGVIEKAIADGATLRDRVASEATEASAELARTKSALADLRAQLKTETDEAKAPAPSVPTQTGTDGNQPATP